MLSAGSCSILMNYSIKTYLYVIKTIQIPTHVNKNKQENIRYTLSKYLLPYYKLWKILMSHLNRPSITLYFMLYFLIYFFPQVGMEIVR